MRGFSRSPPRLLSEVKKAQGKLDLEVLEEKGAPSKIGL
jgi:hypothetical protein